PISEPNTRSACPPKPSSTASHCTFSSTSGLGIAPVWSGVPSRQRRGVRDVWGAHSVFERFSVEALRAVELARDEARSLRSRVVEPEHLLLGLVRQGGGVTGRVLASF